MDEALRRELLDRFEADQAALATLYSGADAYREEFDRTQPAGSTTPWPFAILEWQPEHEAPAEVVHALAVVRGNTAFLQGVVAELGWPGRDLVGEDGADAAWLLLQHAGSGVSTLDSPENRAFRRLCVPLLEQAVSDGRAHPRHLAHTVDGIRAVEGGVPVYAVLSSAFVRNEVGVELAPGLDPAAVDANRRLVGLVPVGEELLHRARGVEPGVVGGEQLEPWPDRGPGRGAP